jgi:hypothetical protein
MANYTIIGGDGKQYGPISAEDLHKWIAEGRLNAQSLAKAESDAEFRPLGTFPEFAILFNRGPAAPSPSAFPPFSTDASHDAALQSIKGPAIALIVTASLDLLFGTFGLIRRQATLDMYSNMPQFKDPQMQQVLHMISGPIGIISYIFQLLVTIIILVAAIRMLALKNHALAFTGAVLAVIPCLTPCCGLLTLPFGIWALVVLNKRDVRIHFN